MGEESRNGRCINLGRCNREMITFSRALFLVATCFWVASASFAAPDCPVPAYAPRSSDKILDWYDAFLRPFRVVAGVRDSPSLSAAQISVQIDKLVTYHRNSLRNSIFFEALTQQIAVEYARSLDFKGLDTQRASKIYQRGSGPDLDFSVMCIDTRTGRSPDDTFAVTLFGMISNDCQHVGLRGLVFSDTLINGATNGECRPDHIYYHRIIFPVMAGTNAVTFLCRKDVGGCLRQ